MSDSESGYGVLIEFELSEEELLEVKALKVTNLREYKRVEAAELEEGHLWLLGCM